MAQVEKQLDNAARRNLSRCMKPKDFGNITNCTLHHFSDASQSGYGQCSYRAQIHCCLLTGKSRVTPLKFISIPRLELTAAALSVKISKMSREELDVHVDDEIFWTDSQVILGYINSDVRRFKVFVANRVQQIRDHTSTKQWHFIESGHNTEDDASRGLDSKMKHQIKRWFNGSSFLRDEKQGWLQKCEINEVSEEDPELKKVISVNTTQFQENSLLTKLQERISSWTKMKRVMALILVIKEILLKRIDRALSWQQLSRTIDVEMIHKGQVAILKTVQAESFDREIKQLMSKKGMVPNYSSTSQLDPFLDSDNIIRVRERLRKSSLTEAEQHPVILPKKSAVSDAIIQWSHISVAHGERGLTLNHLRNNSIWIISANAAVRRVIHRCLTRRKLQGKTSFQKMADLQVES